MLGFTGSRKWVYPQAISGRWQRVHRVMAVIQHLLLFVTPWIWIGGHPALRVDLPARRLYLLGSVFTAHDGFFLVLLGLLAAFTLFFVTSLFGRLWCGYLCPQTVFLEEWIRPIERLVEGDRVARMRRDRGSWTFDRVWRRGVKWGGFLLVAFVLSMTFQSYFAGAHELWTFRAGPVDAVLVGAFTAGWFLDFAWFREQLCNYVCPYARFQGALTDAHSLVVSYDALHGEPREAGRVAAADGRCIDCGKCVAVCPQGVDIRTGFQLECITCARCVDACEDVLGKLGRPSLIGYTTIAKVEGKKTQLIRPRTVAYLGLLGVVGTVMTVLLVLHKPIEATVNRSPGTLFQVESDGEIRNTFLVRLTNNDSEETRREFRVAVEGLPENAETMVVPVALGPAESAVIPLAVTLPREFATGAPLPFSVRISSGDDVVLVKASFTRPLVAPGEG